MIPHREILLIFACSLVACFSSCDKETKEAPVGSLTIEESKGGLIPADKGKEGFEFDMGREAIRIEIQSQKYRSG